MHLYRHQLLPRARQVRREAGHYGRHLPRLSSLLTAAGLSDVRATDGGEAEVKLYLAGPMTGIPQFNIPAFDEMARTLRGEGYEVVSPAELDGPETRAVALASPDGAPGSGSANGETFGDFLGRDVKMMVDDGIDAVVVLPGWDRSKGARIETFVAYAICGMPVLFRDRVPPHILLPVSRLSLFRAWCAEPHLTINTPAFRRIPRVVL